MYSKLYKFIDSEIPFIRYFAIDKKRRTYYDIEVFQGISSEKAPSLLFYRYFSSEF